MLDYRKIEELDLKLAMLGGSGIKIDNLEIIPYTLEEIREYGYTNYMSNLQWLSITIEDFLQSVEDLEKRVVLEQQRAKIKTFDFYIRLGGQNLINSLISALTMVLRTKDINLLDDGVLAVGFFEMGILYKDENGDIQVNEEVLESIDESELKLIHRDNFDDIVEVIKLQNYLTKPKKKDSSEANPVDEETQRLIEDMERHRKRVEEKKNAQRRAEKGDDEDIDISDIISAVSSKSNSINKLNIWSLTLYQMYDEYSRLELIDNYDFSIRAMMAGAEKVDLKHWSSKI